MNTQTMNTTPNSSPGRTFRHFILGAGLIYFGLVANQPASAADKTWNGAGGDGLWHNGANWAGGVLPASGDSLFFGGTVGLANTNNFGVGSLFNGITFNSPSGGFTLAGNAVALGGNITNNQVVTLETINLPLSLSVSPDIDIVQNGSLALNGVVSGSAGITKTGGGQLTLSGANTFTGPVSILGGSVSIGAADNLGAATQLTLDNGALATTASLALDAGVGIAVGDSGGGSGALTVMPGTTLSYGGVIANNGGTGGLTKNGFGVLTLSGANTYTGSTSNRIGTLRLDFTQSGSPADNIIAPGSDLTLGGENAGIGAENEAELDLLGNAGAVNSQTFNSTHLTFAGSVIRGTSGAGGQMNLNLGALSHDPGGTLVIIPAAAGAISTATGANINGILGGFATIGDGSAYTANGYTVLEGTNYATADASGTIVNFANYFTWAAGNLNGQVTIASNLLFHPSSPSVITVDNDNAESTTEVNTIKLMAPETGTTAHYYGLYIGPGNTLRLGQYGGILKNDFSEDVITIGGANNSVQTGNGATGSGDIGTITAGGADNAPGEIVMDANAHDETHGTTIFEAAITDNGAGPVTFIKTGPGSIKLDGHNTFSGGLYLLQGRVQFAGSEIGNPNPDGGGTGPIYILPGSYFFPSGVGAGVSITNAIFVAGIGDAAEPLGAFRDAHIGGPVTLIGDADFGAGHTGASGSIFDGPISGPFNLTLGSLATINGEVTLNNPSNDWTGNTILSARTINGSGANIVTYGTNNAFPHGFGKGNVVLDAGSRGGTITWNLNGFNATVNGLSSSGLEANAFIENAGANPSTLTIGDNNQSGTFGGVIEDGGGPLSLTKIGGGVETLTSGNNTYSGPTVVNGGTLALSGSGSLGSSASVQVNSGATLDYSGVTGGFSSYNPIGVDGGTLIGDTSSSGISDLELTNATVALSVSPAKTNLVVSTLNTSGGGNVINIASVLNVTSYPARFTLVQYGSLGGAGFNFTLGSVPTVTTSGYVSNDVADSEIVLVLTSGPKALTWAGSLLNNDWDVAITANWLFSGNAVQFNNLDSALFDDTALTNTVNLATVVLPNAITVDASKDYTFSGDGAISGAASLTKDGTGTLKLFESGGDTFNGGVTVNAGSVVFGTDNSITGGTIIASGATVQVGTNGATGNLPAGNVADDGTLNLNRTTDMTIAGAMSGTGALNKSGTNVLTLSGDNSSFTGAVYVAQGALIAGSGTALGNGTNTIASGATLDVNGQTLDTTAHVVVSGAGTDGSGAIVNSGGDNQNALGDVTLAGNTTFGGTGRWDIRGGAFTQLSTSGSAYNLTKTGANFISLAGVTVDPALANINIQQGTLEIGTTTGLGNSSDTLTVSAGATLQLYNAGSLGKTFVLNGDGTNNTLSCNNGTGNVLSGPVTLNGACIFNSGTGDALAFDNTLSGGGSMTQTGGGAYVIGSSASATYTGGTTVNGGTLVVDGAMSGSVSVQSGATLAGLGNVSGNVTVSGGTVSPGDAAATPQAMLTVGNLTLSNATSVFELSDSTSGGNDELAAGGLTLQGTNTLRIVPLSFMNVGDTYTLLTYTGAALSSSATNQLKLVVSRPYFNFSIDLSTAGSIKIKVLSAVGNDTWTGANSSAWDTSAINWTRNGNPVAFNGGDAVTFDDSSTVTNVSLSGTLSVSGLSELSYGEAYTFGGTGSLSGPGGLDFEGVSLTIANSGTNTFTGATYIASGTLQLGNGGAGGNLGSGALTNNGTLVFDRSDNGLTLSNNISGSGSTISNIGPGTVTLAGANNNFSGTIVVANGTLRTLNNAALGDPTAAFGAQTYVNTNATLDVGANAVELGNDNLYIAGAGVGGNGAIINSSGSGSYGGAGGNFYNLTLTGDATIGGTGRMDMRNGTATPILNTSPAGSPYTLTKVGPNLFNLVNVVVDSGLGDINVKGGTFGLQGTMSLGNSASNLTVYAHATLDFYSFTNPLDKVLVLEDGSTVSVSHSPDVTFAGPVTLDGAATFYANSASFIVTNVVSGAGSLLKTGSHNLSLSGPLSYQGNTTISAGALALIGNSLPASPVIDVEGTLDLSQAASTTLTPGLGQTLTGGGTITGSLAAQAGSTVSPGNGVKTARLTVSGTATLGGNVLMGLNLGNALTNDELSATTISAGGTLTVTNLGPDLVAGDTFQLFSVPVSGFTAVNLPTNNAAGNATYQWENDLATSGSITLTNIIGGMSTMPTNIMFSVVGGNLTLAWPADHTGWTLQAQTNSSGAGLNPGAGAWFDVPGSTNVDTLSITIDPAQPTVFYRLKL